MVEKLQNLLNKAYAPYSNFRVACILEMNDGKEICGVNVENASFGGTICAERNAITTAITNGYKKGDFKTINIMVDSNKISTCCFMCRQVISEFCSNEVIVNCFNNVGDKQTYTVKELCVYPFNEGDLK